MCRLIVSLLITGLAASAFQARASQKNRVSLNFNGDWTVFLNVKPPKSFYKKLPTTLKSPDGKAVKGQITKLKGDTINLGAMVGKHFQVKDTAVLYYPFTSAEAGEALIGASADYWMEVYCNDKKVYSTMGGGNRCSSYTPDDHVFMAPVVKGKNLLAVKVLSGSAGWRFVCGKPKNENAEPIVLKHGEAWKTIDVASNHVKAGTALDQSAITAIPSPGGLLSWLGLSGRSEELPRLGISATGKLVALDNPDVPVRLRSGPIHTTWFWGGHSDKDPDWKENWKNWAADFKRQGYNMARTGYDAFGGNGDWISEKVLDKADYLTSTLANEGIYSFVTLSSAGFFLKYGWGAPERRGLNLKMMLGDEEVRQGWKNGVTKLMTHVNPYNGVAWKDAPYIACVELCNEQTWAIFRMVDEMRPRFNARYQLWLKEKYQTPEALAKAWNDTSIKTFSQVAAPKRFPFRGGKARENDMVLFCADLFRENAQWMTKTLRETGYRGLIAQYNISRWLGGQEIRYEVSQVAIGNAYHNHPSGFARSGAQQGQNSAVGTAGAYWRSAAATRFADRPYIQTEFNHPLWNPYQHECALFPAYSALQGFSGLSTHSGVVWDSYWQHRPMDNFRVQDNPVLRATEFLSTCLFLRGDLKPSPNRVQVNVPKEYLMKDANGAKAVSYQQTKLALLTGFTISFPWAKPAPGVGVPPNPDVVFGPGTGATVVDEGDGWAVGTKESADTKFSLSDAVKLLRKKGILAASNLTDPGKGIYQSDTGELTMRTKENLLKIITPRSEAISLEANVSEPGKCLKVQSSSVSAMVGACATDDEELSESERVVLLYATEVANTGMTLSANRATLIDLGKKPLLLRVGKVQLTLRNENAADMKLYALGLDGVRREELPTRVDGDILSVTIDTGKLKDGPTSFFELVVED